MPDQYTQPDPKNFNPVLAAEELLHKIYGRIESFPPEHRTSIRTHVAIQLATPKRAVVPGPVSRPGFDLEEKQLTEAEKGAVIQ